MIALVYAIILALTISLIMSPSLPTVLAINSNSINSFMSTDFGDNLKSKINNLMSNVLNKTGNTLNSSLLTNESNSTSSDIIISSNEVISTVNSNGSDSGGSSSIKAQVKTINGVCSSIKVGGNGNDTIASAGECNDEMTGGPGADKFTCGDGNDTIKDFNPKEGDVILDKQNCETVQ